MSKHGPWPVSAMGGYHRTDDDKPNGERKMATSNFMVGVEGSGFKMTFASGWTISVQWSTFHYCDNRHRKTDPTSKINECSTAEIACIRPDGQLARITPNDAVLGWQSADDVAAWIAKCVAGTVEEYEESTWLAGTHELED